MELASGECGDLVLLALTGEEMHELLAFECNYVQLVPRKSQLLLEDAMRRYRIPRRRMARYLRAPELSRDDVWELQILKRRRSGDHRAVRVLKELRNVEDRHGVRLLDHLPALRRRVRAAYHTGAC
ncbi:MAG: hypothetical protein ACYTGB_03875 [Planctomycetota bacterium]